MKMAVISDSHDNVWKVRTAIPRLMNVDILFHCGDLCSPFMIKEFAQPLGHIPIHVVWGNNEGDTYTIGVVASSFENVQLHGVLAEVDVDGVQVGVNHYPQIAEGLARSGSYKLVCYGHDHEPKESWLGDCLFLNPGELTGMNGPSQFAIIDSETWAIERVILE